MLSPLLYVGSCLLLEIAWMRGWIEPSGTTLTVMQWYAKPMLWTMEQVPWFNDSIEAAVNYFTFPVP